MRVKLNTEMRTVLILLLLWVPISACGRDGAGAVETIPTPDDGGSCRMSNVTMARAVADFPLALPEPVPEGYSFDGVIAEAPFIPDPDAELVCEGSKRLTLFYINGSDGTVRILETSQRHSPTGDEHREVLQFSDVEVTKQSEEYDDGRSIDIYEWFQDGVTIQITGLIQNNVTTAVLESFVQAMISS